MSQERSWYNCFGLLGSSNKSSASSPQVNLDADSVEYDAEEAIPLIKKEPTPGEIIFSASDIAKQGLPLIGTTAAGSFAAYGFVLYSQGLLDSWGWGNLLSKTCGFICGVPIAILSGVSGAKVIAGIVSDPLGNLKGALKKLLTLGVWHREDLWQRNLDSTLAWGFLQLINGLAGFIHFCAAPISVIASDALNYEKSHTWASTGPNSGSSFLMNMGYLKDALDMALNKLAASLGDNDNNRNELLRMLSGLKKELPNFATINQEDFLTWLKDFLTKFQDIEKKLIELAKLQQKISDSNPDPKNYENNWSVFGLIMLIPALIFTLPLYRAGGKAKTIFAGVALMGALVNFFPSIIVSLSSLLCNIMINGINAYFFGEGVGNFASAVAEGRIKEYLSELHWYDWVTFGFAATASLLSTIAQIGSAVGNPLINSSLPIIFEACGVAMAALALYFRSANNAGNRGTNYFIECLPFRNLKSIDDVKNMKPEEQAAFINVAVKLVNAHIDDLTKKIQAAAYKEFDQSTPIQIQSFCTEPEIQQAIENLPEPPKKSSWWSCCTSMFGYSNKPATTVNHEHEEADRQRLVIQVT